ncbi:MAG: N-acetyltransferase [Alphaproteobacteria bacterium]|nr:N-acetyltransferase [Alphaproteobacteria bacterium]
MVIREEQSSGFDAIRAVHLSAFPSANEADLVEALRRDGDAVISLVAMENDLVTGHVLFSRMRAPARALGLAPVAVLPAFRRQGVAARLIEAGLRMAAEQGWEMVFVLGDPAYYQRFGFGTGQARDFISPYAGEHFMVRALVADAPRAGNADYAAAFSRLS